MKSGLIFRFRSALYAATLLSLGIFALLAADTPSSTPPSTNIQHVVTAPDATLELLADGFKFTEGPAADREGNVFFTDQPNNRIMKWSVDGKLTTFMQPAGRANGLEFDAKGNLLACADEKNQLWRITPATNVAVLIQTFSGKRFNGPNDVWVHPKGGYYFTDPFYKRDYWSHTDKPQDGQHVYYLSEDGKTCLRVIQDLVQPNGIIGSPDGKTLFVADIGDRKTYRYTINNDFTIADKKLFTSMGSDGMTLDEQGNVYLTGQGVTVFDPNGNKIDHIAVPESWTANVAFGGPDHKTLFITAMDSLYAIKTKFRGY